MDGTTPNILLLDKQPTIVSLDDAKRRYGQHEQLRYSLHLRDNMHAFHLFDELYEQRKTSEPVYILAARLAAMGVYHSEIRSTKFLAAATIAVSFLNVHGHRVPTDVEKVSKEFKCIVDLIKSLRVDIRANDEKPLMETLLAIVLARFSKQPMHIDVAFTPRREGGVTFSHWQGFVPPQGWPFQSQQIQSQPSQVGRALLKCKELEDQLGQLILTLDGCDSQSRAEIDMIFGFSEFAMQRSATQDGQQSTRANFLSSQPIPLREQLKSLLDRLRY